MGTKSNDEGVVISGEMKKADQAKKDELRQNIMDATKCTGVKIDISCKVQVGDKMGVITGANKICINEEFDEGLVDIEHKEGEVILLDLWATWCGPCQKPMEHNQEMLAKGKETWKDKVRIVGLGTDQGRDALLTRIKEKNWTKIEHYWVSNGTCTASADFGAGGIPHCLLVDTTGTIVWSGHPMSIPLEDRIDELLTGKNPFAEAEGPKEHLWNVECDGCEK